MTPNGTGPRTCAIWARVSSTDGTQTTENQTTELREWAARRDLEVVAEFVTEDSAWASSNGNGRKGTEFDAKRAELLDGARLGRYQVVLCWGLDRLSRRGAEDMLAFVRRLTETGCELWSSKDPWVETMKDAFAREMLLSVFATIARFESQRRSERIKAGMARRKREGKPVGGRVKGSKDRKPRRVAGSEATTAAWQPGGPLYEARERRRAAEREALLADPVRLHNLRRDRKCPDPPEGCGAQIGDPCRVIKGPRAGAALHVAAAHHARYAGAG